MISTQVDPATKVALAGVLPSTKRDAACLLDQAYADRDDLHKIFRDDRLNDDGLWGAVLYKDRMLKGGSAARADAIAAYYKKWLPPWKRVPAPAASSPRRSTRKRSRS